MTSSFGYDWFWRDDVLALLDDNDMRYDTTNGRRQAYETELAFLSMSSDSKQLHDVPSTL